MFPLPLDGRWPSAQFLLLRVAGQMFTVAAFFMFNYSADLRKQQQVKAALLHCALLCHSGCSGILPSVFVGGLFFFLNTLAPLCLLEQLLQGVTGRRMCSDIPAEVWLTTSMHVYTFSSSYLVLMALT